MEGQGRENDGTAAGKQEVEVVGRRRVLVVVRRSGLVLRLLALSATLVAAVVLGVDQQRATVPVTIVPSLPPVNLPVTAKWHDMSAFKYFVVANAIAGAYTGISIVLSVASRGRAKPGLSILVLVIDLVMVALLFSSNGAALAVGVLGYEGNSHVRWDRVCGVFDVFCHRVAVAIAISLLGSMAYVLLVLLTALNLHK